MEITKNILITGATGYIGNHLIRRLACLDEYHVTALVRDSSDLQDISDIKENITYHQYKSNYDSINLLFQKKSFYCVFHLAAFSSNTYKCEDIHKIMDSNIILGTYILEAMKQNNCQYLINTSTYWQHFKKNKPNSLYAATKNAFEDIIDFFSLDGTIKAISLKLHDVYGYDDHRPKLLNNLIKNQNSNKVYDLTRGEQKHYMVFIDDVIDAYIEAFNLIQKQSHNTNHTIYGVYGREKFSLKEIVGIIEKSLGKKLTINWGKKEYYKFQIMEPHTGNRLENWEPKILLQEGIKLILNKD